MNTWLLTVFAAVVGIYNGYMGPAFTAFFLSFTSMQLVEYFLWTYLKNPTLNSVFSGAGLALITSQPLFSILQVSNPAQLYPLLITYAVFAAYTLYLTQTPLVRFSTTVASNGHLLWKWLPTASPLYTTLYMALLFTPLYLKGYTLGLLAGIATLLVSVATYGAAGTWGSMWCWIAALLSLGIIGQSLWRGGICK